MKLQIEKVVYGGAGLAHPLDGAGGGEAVLVPLTLPGEVVEAKPVPGTRGPGEAELVRVIEASSQRVEAPCQHFGACGGCQLQHAEYGAQVRIKTEVLREMLQRVGLIDLPKVLTHTAEPWSYRNRIRLRVEVLDGALRMGYNRRGSKTFLAVQECPIAETLLWRAASAMLELARTDALVDQWLRSVVEVELFADAQERRLQMNFFMRKAKGGGFQGVCKALQAVVPEFAGAGISLLASEAEGRSRRMERPVAGDNWGAGGLLYEAAGREYWVSRGGFFQVNRFLVDEMVNIVTTGRSGMLAWDLYAGVGLFSRALAESFEQVVAVEGGATAAADLIQGSKTPGMRSVRASTLEFLQAAVIQRERPDLIVMDPPRAGVGAEVCALLARFKTAEIVYVSCDPMTLARDLHLLVGGGYRLQALHFVDMFPQTFHIETIAILHR